MRQPKFVTWLQCLISPILQINGAFLLNRDKNLYRLNHDSRVFSMENVFNDRFDHELRRIYITDGFNKDRVYIYTRAENKPVYLNTIYIYNSADYADTGADFIVWVPAAIYLSAQDLIELTGLVNEYKLPSKRFKIYRS
jgi:hypothetical protein